MVIWESEGIVSVMRKLDDPEAIEAFMQSCSASTVQRSSMIRLSDRD
jgi:hypothetical protein